MCLKKILNETELRSELKAEEDAEWRAYQAEKRVRQLALGKTKCLIESRCTLLPCNLELKQAMNNLERQELEIFSKEQVQDLKLQETQKKNICLC